MQLVGPDAIQGRDAAAQDVIAAAVAAGALDRADVTRFFDHAEQGRIAPRVAADRARILIREIAARPARHDLPADPPDGVRQPLRGFRRLLQ